MPRTRKATKSLAAKTPATKKSAKQIQYYDEQETQSLIVIHGPPASGKTHLAATFSEYFPTKLPSPKQVGLDDLLWIPWDAGACEGLRSHRIRVPAVPVDTIIRDNATIVAGIREVIATAIVMAEQYGSRAIVVDTITKMDKILVSHWQENCPIQNGTENTQAMYGKILANHVEFYSRLINSGRTIIACAHSKPVGEPRGDKEQHRINKAARQVAGTHAVVIPNMTGQGKDLWTSDASLQIVTQFSAGPRGKDPTYTAFIDNEPRNWETKNRFRSVLQAQYTNANLLAIWTQTL